MKSNKQKRAELKAKKLAREVKAKRRAANEVSAIPRSLSKGLAVNRSALAPDNSYSLPDFVARGYYIDIGFACVDCGIEEVWRAAQQKWWFEVAKGDVWTTARRCRKCRRRVRERRNEVRRVHLEGLARKRGKKN